VVDPAAPRPVLRTLRRLYRLARERSPGEEA
jgi:hypothetical protein